jgi:hypothetical protein
VKTPHPNRRPLLRQFNINLDRITRLRKIDGHTALINASDNDRKPAEVFCIADEVAASCSCVSDKTA